MAEFTGPKKEQNIKILRFSQLSENASGVPQWGCIRNRGHQQAPQEAPEPRRVRQAAGGVGMKADVVAEGIGHGARGSGGWRTGSQ